MGRAGRGERLGRRNGERQPLRIVCSIVRVLVLESRIVCRSQYISTTIRDECSVKVVMKLFRGWDCMLFVLPVQGFLESYWEKMVEDLAFHVASFIQMGSSFVTILLGENGCSLDNRLMYGVCNWEAHGVNDDDDKDGKDLGKHAAMIVDHFAGDIRLNKLPGGIEYVSSMLQISTDTPSKDILAIDASSSISVQSREKLAKSLVQIFTSDGSKDISIRKSARQALAPGDAPCQSEGNVVVNYPAGRWKCHFVFAKSMMLYMLSH
uniref:Uncharacterized protein n=1 Tax=Leersia perrieri TaxID=77586 RepID=A0A0D9Y042_9ORYZ